MTSTTALGLLAILVSIEIVSMVIGKCAYRRHRQILNGYLAGRTIEGLDEQERERVFQAANADYKQTINRKIDLFVFAFHLPALASWGTITRQSTTPPVYYFLVTIGFWFVLVFAVIKVAGLFGLPR
jgi:hypothetical protein